LRKTIDILHKNSKKFENSNSIKIKATIQGIKKCTVEIKIKKIHNIKKHTVEMFFNGEIREDLYHSFINYINENLETKCIDH
jgi:hypothetical protein